MARHRARSCGARSSPTSWRRVMADLGVRFSWTIILIASVNFLGLGLAPPTADWGLMISENRVIIPTNPWAVVAPALMLALLDCRGQSDRRRVRTAARQVRRATVSGQGTPTLRASGLRIDLRGGTPVIDGVDLEIAPGEIFGIVGESGSGKTTTALSLFGQQDRALVMSSGEISLAGERLSDRCEVRGVRVVA